MSRTKIIGVGPFFTELLSFVKTSFLEHKSIEIHVVTIAIHIKIENLLNM